MPSTVSPRTLCCALSQSMTTRVQRSISLWLPSGFSTSSIIRLVVLRTKPGGAERAARGDDRQDVAVIEDALLDHLVAVQRQGGERVGLDFVFGKLVDVFEAIERVVFARRVVLPELDLRAEHRRLRGHPVLHPPRGDEDDVGILPHDLEVGLEPQLRIEVVVHVLDAQIAGDPRAVDDQRHRASCPSFRGARPA